ncbi:YunG family protein [Priestia flexa]
MSELNIDIVSLFSVFTRAWSLHSSSKWTKENPAKGQCGVTSLVIHDLLGGDIVKTPAAGGWHFYNRINDEYHDLTASQFDQPILYQHIPSSRSEAFQDTNAQQYVYLKEQVKINLLHKWGEVSESCSYYPR